MTPAPRATHKFRVEIHGREHLMEARNMAEADKLAREWLDSLDWSGRGIDAVVDYSVIRADGPVSGDEYARLLWLHWAIERTYTIGGAP